MTIEDFAQEVLEQVRDRADGVYNAWLTTGEKNNGIVMTGITAEQSACNCSSCIYLDEYFAAYQSGTVTVGEVADTVHDRIMKGRNHMPDFCVADLLRWDSVKPWIHARLINEERNRAQLVGMPHRVFLDLAVVYYIKVEEEENRIGIIAVFNQMMEAWKQDESVLYEAAMANLEVPGNLLFEDIREFITGARHYEEDMETPEGFAMYVLTNQEKCFGAAGILSVRMLEKIREQIGDFIVLPSSVHEVVLLPERGDGDYEKLTGLVKEVNSRAVLPEEFLSGHVYVYGGDHGELKMAA